MPRTPRTDTVKSRVISAPRSHQALIASARNFSKDKLPTTGVKTIMRPQEWHTVAWDFYDAVGEFRYVVGWIGNLLSRARLVASERNPKTGEWAPSENPDVLEIMDALYGGVDGQSEMLREIGKHFTVTGDAMLMGVPATASDPAGDWLVAASNEVKNLDDEGWQVWEETFPKSTLVIRLWRPHPRRREISDSPTRAVLPILAEIDGLTKHVAAQIDSRLAGAGLLLVPNDLRFGSTPDAPAEDEDADPEADPTPPATSDPDELVRTLIDVFGRALKDRQDPSAIVPIILQGDKDALQEVRHVTFSTPLDQQAIALRTEAIRRFALGMDVPPEVLTGTSDMNHWASWQMEEAAIKAHCEPLLNEIATALTVGYLRPTLPDGVDQLDFAITVDTTQLRLRPNRSKEAIELYDRGRLSAEALLRENGFEASDAMLTPDFLDWMLRKVASGSTTPELVAEALIQLGVPGITRDAGIPEQIRIDSRISQDITEAPSDPSKSEHPEQGPPKEPTAPAKPVSVPVIPNPTGDHGAISDSLVDSSAVMVYRALERAGNRIKTQLKGQIRQADGEAVPAAQAYRHVKLDLASTSLSYLLEDAWGTCEVFASDLGCDAAWLRGALDGYTRDLLRHGKPLDKASLRAHLTLGMPG